LVIQATPFNAGPDISKEEERQVLKPITPFLLKNGLEHGMIHGQIISVLTAVKEIRGHCKQTGVSYSS
jgi:hypothetical protein